MLAALLLALGQEPHRPLSVEQLAAASSFAGVAVVDRIDIRRDADTGANYTDVRLRVLETWSGSLPPGGLLTQVGGTVDGRRSAVAGWNYRVEPGERIVLFAKPWKGPYVVVAGLRQGLAHVDDGGRVTWDLDRRTDGTVEPGAERPLLEALRQRVAQALGRAPAELGRPSPAPSATPDSPGAAAPTAPRPPPKETGKNRAGVPFFLAAGLFAAIALALRLARRRANGGSGPRA
jgi:hypothetical protein